MIMGLERRFDVVSDLVGHHHSTLTPVDPFATVLPRHRQDGAPTEDDPREVTKVALRLKFLLEQVIPCELEEARVTKANSQVITKKVVLAAKEAGGKEHASCVVYCLLVCRRWFKRQAM